MKHILKQILFSLMVISVFALQSCSDQEFSTPVATPQDAIKVVNGRLSFPNEKTYFETIMKVNKMTDAERTEFQKRFKFASLFNRVEKTEPDGLSLNDLPMGHQSVLNANGEVVIGDTIVWYATTGKKHYVLSEQELVKVKQGLVESKVTKSFSIKVGSRSTDKSGSQGRFIWDGPGNGSKESRWQHEFCYHNDCGSRRKYVNELYMAVDGNTYALYIVPKLEWKGAHGWYDAGESRYVTVNIACTVQLTDGTSGHYGATYVPIYLTSTVVGHWNIFIAQDYLYYSNYPIWDIDIRGNIYSVITDDPNSAWDNTGYPLW